MSLSRFSLRTIGTPERTQITYSPERGALITSLRIHRRELLYLDEATFQDPSVNVRGGIPLLFPNAGPIDDPRFPGFLRTRSDWSAREDADGRGFSLSCAATDDTRAVYPYAFLFTFRVRIEADDSVTLVQSVTNQESEQALPISMGLHPYFSVPHAQKSALRFACTEGSAIEQAVEDWANGGTVSMTNPSVLDPSATVCVTIRTMGTLSLQASADYRRFWVWSLPGKDFLCLEPVMRDVGGLANDPYLVHPHETYTAHVQIRFFPDSRETCCLLVNEA